MHKATKKQLTRLEHAIGSAPGNPAVTKAAFELFLKTGELPEDIRVAQAVADWAVTGVPPMHSMQRVDWGQLILAYMQQAESPVEITYKALLAEAIHGPGMVQVCARQALRSLAEAGADMRKPGLSGIEMPLHGGVGMRMLGFPERFATGVQQGQFERLLARVDLLRERLPQGDQRWFANMRLATERFQLDGEMPADERMLEAILVLGELSTLLRAKAGEAVEQELAAFASAASAAGAARTDAVQNLQELAAAGVFAHEAA
jgi:hypothetical protein